MQETRAENWLDTRGELVKKTIYTVDNHAPHFSFGIIDMQAPHRRLPAHRQSGAGELTDDRDALEILMITPLSLEIGPLEGCGR
ncbi:MAG: hypothetical protein JO105_20190 [Hyphomicrobiales bacterium]|nr:hypothetical protein [Hyphomicrobiales bacterium]